MSFKTWYKKQVTTSTKFRNTVLVVAAPVVYGAAIVACVWHCLKDIGSTIVDSVVQTKNTVSDVNAYYRAVFSTKAGEEYTPPAANTVRPVRYED